LLEHFKADLKARNQDPEANEDLINHEKWINAQKLTFLLPVELGSWSGLSTREMAIQTDLQTMYNFSFQTFSGCVHSTWNHICQYNAKPSPSPLHRHTFLPDMPEFSPDVHQLDTVSRRLDETLKLYQQNFGMSEPANSIESWLDTTLTTLSEKYSKS
jgi:hypothetical protein